jgi:enoyl-CoA hydratase
MSHDSQPASVLKIEDHPVESHGVVRRIAVDRPERLNALDSATLDALHVAFDAAAADPAVRVVVLTGSGPKAFVAGADIAEMSALSPAQARDFSLRGTRMMRRVEKMPKPVIAMVNGFALGGGLELAMCCHLRIANRVVPAAELEAETMKLATQLAASAPLALRGMIDCINVGGECGLEEGLEYESAQFGLIFSTEDMREGTQAFLERRKPGFTGR